MDNRKIDTELQLSLELSQEERSRSLDLDVGYDSYLQEWELIVKYSGDLTVIAEELPIVVTPLLNEYAIIRIQERYIARLSEYSQIEYIEKPKSLVLEEMEGIRASCITTVRIPPFLLTGKGVVIAVIDSGIDYTHPDFRNADGSSRILAIWDQSAVGNPPAPYNIGAIYEQSDIERALQAQTPQRQLEILPEVDLSGHGTHVAGIAAGNGRASDGRYVGVAPDAELLIVKLAAQERRGFPRTTQLLQGIDWAVRYCLERQLPLAVNISFGNNYGNHEGTSLLEQYMDDVGNLGRMNLVVGAGNEGNTGQHTGGALAPGVRSFYERQTWEREIEFVVQSYEAGLNIQLWKEYADAVRVGIRTPSGRILGPFGEENRRQLIRTGGTQVALYYGEPTPYSTQQDIYIALIPVGDYIDPGNWAILLYPEAIRDGEYQLWLPATGGQITGTGFLQPSPDLTVTIPATARRAITVGAYDSRTDSYAAFSGRGGGAEQKPDLVAPGVGITAAAPGGGYDTRSGTSMATPFVTGGVTLLMQWGIIDGKDPFLYGEKLKAYLLRGARQLPGYRETPNPQTGWGALCISESIPGFV